MTKPLANKHAIVTGASRGLGREIAKHYVAAGANVFICARNAAALDESLRDLQEHAAAGQVVAAQVADVSNEDDARAVVDAALRHFKRIDILVSNAGVAGPAGAIESVDWQDWVRALEINLLGSVLLCRAVVPLFKEQRSGKIIQISGGGATSPLPMLSAYAASKAAVIRFMETLAEEVRTFGIDVNAIAPGLLKTHMLEEMLTAGPAGIGAALHERLSKEKRTGGTPLSKGAELAVFLGSSRSDGITGKLISAPWDPWTTLPDHIDVLKASDIYTLRRIVPKDRGEPWGNDE